MQKAIVLILFPLSFIGFGQSLSKVDVFVMSFNLSTPFGLGVSEVTRLGKHFVIEGKEAEELTDRIFALLAWNTVKTSLDQQIDMRMVIKVRSLEGLTLGFSGTDFMWVNGKVFDRDEEIVVLITSHITDRQIRKTIRQSLKK